MQASSPKLRLRAGRQTGRVRHQARRGPGHSTTIAGCRDYLPSAATRWVSRDTLRLAEFL
jgi:hypothetical protein